MKGDSIMKNTKKLICFLLMTLMIVGNTVSVVAATQPNEFQYLQNAINKIDAIPSDEINQYLKENREWIDEVGVRLDSYLATIPEEQHTSTITRLLAGNNKSNKLSASLSGNLDEYFNSVKYHYRGGYWTYSLDPKWSVRLWGPTMEAAWEELGSVYSGVRNDNGSLWNQYKCHYDFDILGLIAGDWDLEEGRPLVSYADTVKALCNP